jgi:hypothetical protein
MKKILLISSFLLSLSAGSSLGAQVSPTPGADTRHDGTTTGAAVTVLQAGSSSAGYRIDCTLQNNGTHVMYYSFSGAATTSTTQLLPGAVMNCSNGVTTSYGALSLLGTNTEAYSLSEQFVGAQ